MWRLWFFLSFSIWFFIKNLISIQLRLFAPIFGVKDINSSALWVIGLTEIWTPLHSAWSDSWVVCNPFCDLLHWSPVPLGWHGMGIESHLLQKSRYWFCSFFLKKIVISVSISIIVTSLQCSQIIADELFKTRMAIFQSISECQGYK